MTDETGPGRRRPKKYRLVRVPWWIRGVVGGALFGAVMFGYARSRDDRSGGLLFDVVVWGVAAVVFAMLLTLIAGTAERRIFAAADGGTLSADERVRVLQAVDAGRWPQQESLRPAASRLVEQRLGRTERPAFQLAVFGVMLALAVYNALTQGSWWWCAAAFWLVAGPWSLLAGRRRRRPAQALRDRSFA